MRAIFIDAKNRTIAEIDHIGQLADMYSTLGVQLVTTAPAAPDADLWLDDEGAVNGTAYGFQMRQRFFGNGLLLGFDDDGNCADLPARITLDMVRHHVLWLEARERPTLERAAAN